jgi:hypothetical protein
VDRFIGYARRAARRADTGTDPVRIARLFAARRWLLAADLQIERALIAVERAAAEHADRTQEEDT